MATPYNYKRKPKKKRMPNDIGWDIETMDKWKTATKANNPFTQQAFGQVTEQTANATVAVDNKIKTAMDQKMIDHLLGRDKHKDVVDTFAQEYMLPVDRGIVGDARATTYDDTMIMAVDEATRTKSTTEECLEDVLGQELAMSLAKESIENKIEPVVLLMWIIDNHYNPME